MFFIKINSFLNKIGPLWAHKGPYGPIRAHMGPNPTRKFERFVYSVYSNAPDCYLRQGDRGTVLLEKLIILIKNHKIANKNINGVKS